MSDEVTDGRRPMADLLELKEAGVDVKIVENYHIYSGVEVEIEPPPDDGENGDDNGDPPIYFRLQILESDNANFHRVLKDHDLEALWNIEGGAVMAINGMIVKPVEWWGKDGNRWFRAFPVQLDAEGKLKDNYKGWKVGEFRRTEDEAKLDGWLPFDLPGHKVIMHKLLPGDLPG